MDDHYKARLSRFYGAHDPTKIGTIDKLLAKVNGNPANFKLLMGKLTSKYGPEPEGEDESEYESEEESDEEDEDEEEEELTSSMAKTRIGEIVDPFEDRLKRFYKAHEPRRLAIVQTLVSKMGGKRTYQEELMGLLVEKYGPEPVDQGNEMSIQEQCDNFLEARLNRFYGAYKPESLPLVDGLVIRTRGVAANQDQLITMMTDKFGPEPIPEGTYDVAAAQAAIVNTYSDEEEEDDEEDEFNEEDVRQRLVRFYSTYQPEKISDVDKMLKKAQGSIDQIEMLFGLLVKKYGPEPEDPNAGAGMSDHEEESEEEEEDDEEEQGSDSDGEEEEENSLFRNVVYNPVDGFPPEYSEFLPTFKQSLPWLLQTCPDLKLTTQKGKTVAEYAQGLQDSGLDLLVGAGEKVSGKRHGGAALPNRKKGGKKGGGATEVTIELVKRNKRRNVTIVIGLDSFDVKMKQAAKALGKKFACGASVNKMPTGGQCIEIQGDVIYDCPGVVVEMFPTVKPDIVFRIQDTKKSKAF